MTFTRSKNPPCHDDSPGESPIEDIFFTHLMQVVHWECDISKQLGISPSGFYRSFRLDLIVMDWERFVGFECDGKQFHKDPDRDHWRDCKILGVGIIDRIYRIRGTDIWNNIWDVLDLLRVQEPQMFSESGHKMVDSLKSKQYTDLSIEGDSPFPFGKIRYRLRLGAPEQKELALIRWTGDIEPVYPRQDNICPKCGSYGCEDINPPHA